MEANFYRIDEIDDSLLKYAVIIARYKDKWVWVKNKKRKTWEVPGGHREENEEIFKTAERELYEETGAIKFDIKPICVYSATSYGMLFFAEITEFGSLPESEIEEIGFFENRPKQLSFPMIQPKLFEQILLNNIDKLHTTKLGIGRIKQNLGIETNDVVEWCRQEIKQSDKIIRTGKNWYINIGNAVITDNANSYTIITAHKIAGKV